MTPKPFSRCSRSAACITLLVVSLLFAQALGLVHSIVHAGWQPGQVHSLIDESLFDYGEDHAPAVSSKTSDGKAADGKPAAHNDAHHSCVAYDAATLAAAMHFDFPLPPLLPPTRVLALWQAFASWDAPVDCYFSPRAPPH